MSILLVLLSTMLTMLLLQLYQRDEGTQGRTLWRNSFLKSLLIHALLIYLVNELLSYFGSINRSNILAFWVVLAVTEALLLIRFSIQQEDWRKFFSYLIEMNSIFKSWNSSERLILFLAICVYLIPIAILTYVVPPNNYDGHSYHLSRIVEWISNGNLDHFPTRHIQQLYHNVFAEYLVLHTFLLSGSDRFAGFVQFTASLGTFCAISLIAKSFGAHRSTQILAVIFMLTLPAGIMESSTVQVDYVACFFICCFIYFGYLAVRRFSASAIFFMAISLTLGGFSKYTILLLALPFCIYFGLQFLKKYQIKRASLILITILTLFILVFSPFLARNYQFFGHPMHPMADTGLEIEKLSTDQISLQGAVSNVMKNATLQMGLPNNDFNLRVASLVQNAHQFLGYTVDDPRFSNDTFQVRYVVHEDMIPNTLHFVILLGSFIFLTFSKGYGRLKWFSILILLGFILLCTFLKFQLWSTRTQMPIFALGSVVVASMFGKYAPKTKSMLALFLLLASCSFVLANPSKPILPLKYYSKKLLLHIPIAVCPQNDSQRQAVQEKLSTFYTRNPAFEDCLQLLKQPNTIDRRYIFNVLDSIGYFDHIKKETIFKLDRTALYFLNHTANGEKYRPLMNHIQGTDQKIGLLFDGNYGFYHYLSSIQGDTFRFDQMKYIGYRPRYKELVNASKPFHYAYILGDDRNMLGPYYENKLIDTVYYSQDFYLAKLKRTSELKFYYP
ncbi:ArnT family glycosyltransferase [Dyadobacter tibetensis]|uniref:ArnT family glycosyltransferase n=1 Tax=Dyadobacter tibetensis TaxID=1211851 RepID=UPI0004728033|nr:glycosyltransferase family 39 protein [Dyadobacter tibetensis]